MHVQRDLEVLILNKNLERLGIQLNRIMCSLPEEDYFLEYVSYRLLTFTDTLITTNYLKDAESILNCAISISKSELRAVSNLK